MPRASWADSITPYLDRTEAQIQEFTLDNGMKFIVLERHEAPIISFMTYADAGGANEPPGKTGVAHFLEHLAFKGTPRIGTTNYEAEAPLLEQLNDLHEQIRQAQADGDEARVKELQENFRAVQQQASEYVVQNEFGQIVEQYGGVGLNATTSADATRYFYSFPANKLELWMSLESERFLEPVFREFYEEQDVILEERRLGTDNSAIGSLVEEFLLTAFSVHPYRQPVIGHEADIRNLTPKDTWEFYETYYVPNNLTVAIVGDVKLSQVQDLAQTYFGRYEAGPTPPEVQDVEPPQEETRDVEVRFPSQPLYLEGYHRPARTDADNAAYELLVALLSDGRTSRLYQSLVEQEQVALNAQGLNGFPGDKFPNLLLFYAVTAPNHSLDEVQTLLRQELDQMRQQTVSRDDLERVKTQAKARLLRSLNSNSGMASLLAEYQAKTGDWHNLFREIQAIDAVTANDIRRLAQETFTPENRTIGKLLPS
ncbi:insulinase family protein [Phormidium yuhuli AB48]|uniref:Insulinase family protein n=1 Tax=Phormidium yuhuli AB48 TaxID=2940671 RepID=A0ABY5AV85_9CYAN|nr:pitrilysin family protein [Phormidium yuhuli]USR93147.1 insulinase family protein [Phormidium yuhuli AB48]